MSWNNLKEYCKWLGQLSAATSVIIVVYFTNKPTFASGGEAGTLFLIAIIITVFTFIFGVLSLPRWQGFLALIIFSFNAYWLCFTPNMLP
jgi:type IV secretory pathway VirB2 component (pilin)